MNSGTSAQSLGVFQGVDHAGVAAPNHHHQPPIRAYPQREVVINRIAMFSLAVDKEGAAYVFIVP
jgi:hypothetical protein